MTSPLSTPAVKASSSTPKVTGTVRSKNPLKGAVEILPVSALTRASFLLVCDRFHRVLSRYNQSRIFTRQEHKWMGIRANPLSFLCSTSISQERLYYAALSKLPPSHNILASIPKRDKYSDSNNIEAAPPQKKQIHFFCIDNELVYWNFFLDFGPLNLGQLTRFCKKLNDKLRKFPAVCFYSCTDNSKRANAIFLICIWQMLYLERSPDRAYAGFDKHVLEELTAWNNQKNSANKLDVSQPPVSVSQGAPTIAALPNFHDASPCPCTYDLTVLDCLKGFAKARMHGFFDLETFDVEEYEYFEQVEVRSIKL